MNKKNQIKINLNILLIIIVSVTIIIIGCFFYKLVNNYEEQEVNNSNIQKEIKNNTASSSNNIINEEDSTKILRDITKVEISVMDENSTEGIQYTKPVIINDINQINTLLDIINSSSLYSDFDNDYGAGGYFEGCPLVNLYTSDGNIVYLSACDNFDEEKELNIFYISKLEEYSDKIIYKTNSKLQKYIENLYNKYK